MENGGDSFILSHLQQYSPSSLSWKMLSETDSFRHQQMSPALIITQGQRESSWAFHWKLEKMKIFAFLWVRRV